ncbi:hypothetical protein DM793_19730 [Paenarthrobacter nitroguajacolicus]|uniref:hypothetical protein n=1 Tax=Paenarthrobacter nitroguajacolicus TaxID=211146 RepID=UPI0015C0D4D9|nr:hypothetical protein [Paenarthrobacter nitroguajacolicus]NWL13498.1 hypothetical protein [Paenarthrobacter nitroguajacolicus]
MAITTTPLGFQKPDGNEPFRQGNDVISANAQKAQDLLSFTIGRLGAAEASLNAGAGGVGLSEDPLNPGLYYFAGPSFDADPINPGFYLIGS